MNLLYIARSKRHNQRAIIVNHWHLRRAGLKILFDMLTIWLFIVCINICLLINVFIILCTYYVLQFRRTENPFVQFIRFRSSSSNSKPNCNSRVNCVRWLNGDSEKHKRQLRHLKVTRTFLMASAQKYVRGKNYKQKGFDTVDLKIPWRIKSL